MQKHPRETFVLQPSNFRKDSAKPEWMHLPKLHLLLGWGHGVWETLGETMIGLRHVFIPDGADVTNPTINWLFVHRENYYLTHWAHRDNAPDLRVEGIGTPNVLFRDDAHGVHRVNCECGGDGVHVVADDGEYRVRHHFGRPGMHSPDGDPMLTLERRTKRLKDKFQKRMAKYGIVYASGTCKRSERADGKRTPEEQAFVRFVSELKDEFLQTRLNQLMKDPASRPADFGTRRDAHVRSRRGEMELGKLDRDGKLKVPYTEEELLERTCGEIARRDATSMMYDFTYVPALSLGPDGPVLWPQPERAEKDE